MQRSISKSLNSAPERRDIWARRGFLDKLDSWGSVIGDMAVPVAEQWEIPCLASDLFWGQLPYPREDMDEKTIEFKTLIKWPEHKQVALTSGTGKMFIRERADGFHVKIVSTVSRHQEKVIDLTQAQAKLIKRRPDGSECAFLLLAT
jgi:hypothetical protein